ncbi:MAG: tRNA (guanosine(37)-N1)-methyltransferase TrmD [Clostridiales bacterium]|jgi:tRNA (guanine37-N1)-methyltransferase|nr:tRNA (guanosine(37)-N1)-methyltransferase TrmD [Clostridiales bacterium]
MNFYVLTIFPEMVNGGLNHSIIKRAVGQKLININTVDIREFSEDKHKKVDDYPFGGGAGMVMAPGPIYNAYSSIKDRAKGAKVIYLSPQGKVFNQKMAEGFSKLEDIIFICGHYEGIDERLIELIVTEEISIGDFVMTGGELAAMVIIDSVSRLLPGVLGSEESPKDESFTSGRLEYPQYTRPREFMGKQVPEILLSGNHKEIEGWRKQQSILRTTHKRPDLL